jgi:hypothetical protein
MTLIVSEIKTINVEQCIPAEPLYLRWQVTPGGYDQWLFSINQKFDAEASSMENFQQVVNYLEEENTNVNVLKKNGNEVVTLGADNLTLDEVNGISTILTSPKVYVISGTPGSDDFTRICVLVKTGTFSLYETADTRHRIEFQIVSPNYYFQAN